MLRGASFYCARQRKPAQKSDAQDFQCLRASKFLDSRMGEVGKIGALGEPFNLIVTDFVVQTRPADVECARSVARTTPLISEL